MDRSRAPSNPRRPQPAPESAPNIRYNPSRQTLVDLAAHDATRTEYGSLAFRSAVCSRSADRTKNAIDDAFDAEDYGLLREGFSAIEDRDLLCLDRQLGRHQDHRYVCRYYVPERYARIALSLATLLEPAPEGASPDFVTVQLPDHERTAIRIDPAAGETVVLGSDYTGEAKKSFLRLFMYQVKRTGGLGLHAGSKRVTLRVDEELREVGQLFLGLSATGKSTLTAHGYFLDAPERTTVVQDDVCALLPDGSVAGSEGNGLYVKTEGLDPEVQAELYAAVTDDSSVLENVVVDDDGSVDLDASPITANGRAAIHRSALGSADPDIDLDHVDQLFFITRNPVMPPVAKLSPTQAAAAFMLGESVETSAGDPERAGEAVRVVGTNPFIIGPPGEEGNRFRELIAANEVDCYVLNTGEVGEGGRDIGVEATVTILREIARETVSWEPDPTFELALPTAVPDLDIAAFHPSEHVPDLDDRLRQLRQDRRAYLERFDRLDSEIIDAIY